MKAARRTTFARGFVLGACLVWFRAFGRIPNFAASGPVQRLPSRASRASGSPDETAAPTTPLQPPAVNYFTNQDIVRCLEEGCSVEALEDLSSRLATDEERFRSTMEELQAAQSKEYSADVAEILGWLRNVLDNSCNTKEQLKAAKEAALDGEWRPDFPSQLVQGSNSFVEQFTHKSEAARSQRDK